MDENDFDFPELIANREMGSTYGVYSVPTSYLIDRVGLVPYHHVGYASGDKLKLERKLVDLLAIELSSWSPPVRASLDVAARGRAR